MLQHTTAPRTDKLAAEDSCWAFPHTGYLTPRRQGHFVLSAFFVHSLITSTENKKNKKKSEISE